MKSGVNLSPCLTRRGGIAVRLNEVSGAGLGARETEELVERNSMVTRSASVCSSLINYTISMTLYNNFSKQTQKLF